VREHQAQEQQRPGGERKLFEYERRYIGNIQAWPHSASVSGLSKFAGVGVGVLRVWCM
jgi:hypothetical protein